VEYLLCAEGALFKWIFTLSFLMANGICMNSAKSSIHLWAVQEILVFALGNVILQVGDVCVKELKKEEITFFYSMHITNFKKSHL